MVDLARQAFSSRNFELAAEIYERSISEHGPKSDLLLGLADSLAKGGHYEKAFEAYSKACRVGQVTTNDLKHLVTALVNSVKQEVQSNGPEMNKEVIFDCLICRNILSDPVTIPCGHTFCRVCLLKDPSKQCKSCGSVHHYFNASRVQSNVLLVQILEKCFPEHCKAVRLKKRANSAFQNCSFQDAILLYSEAIEIVHTDHVLYSNRSHAYASLDKYREALADADSVLQLRPDWPKGYFRRGCALFGLEKYEESVVALLQCLALDSSIETAKEYLSKALHNILSPLSPDDPKSAALSRQLNPTVLERLIRSNFDSSLLLPPRVTVDTVRHLKDIISNTLSTASTFLEGKESRKRSSAALESDELPLCSTSSQRCSSAPGSRSESPALSHKRHNSIGPGLGMGSHPMLAGLGQGASCLSGEPDKEKDTGKPTPVYPSISPELLVKEELECALCYRLLHMPVTTPCGHTFCRHCLDRVLDHKTECPLCKSSLVEYLAERRQTVTSAIEKLLEVYFPAETELRRQQHEEEITDLASMGADNQHEIPVFVCTIAFPQINCPLHIFEPRYRLMVRQCMESGRRQFGMCISTGDNPEDFSEYGCMLEIRDVQYFPDGRSLVDTIGGKRFKVVGRGQREGYCTAKVEFLEDSAPENIEELKQLSETTYATCKAWLDSLAQTQRSHISQHLGNFPGPETDTNYGTSGTAWHWWMLAVMPLDPRIQLAMMAMTSYKERLKGLKRVIGYLQNKRESR